LACSASSRAVWLDGKVSLREPAAGRCARSGGLERRVSRIARPVGAACRYGRSPSGRDARGHRVEAAEANVATGWRWPVRVGRVLRRLITGPGRSGWASIAAAVVFVAVLAAGAALYGDEDISDSSKRQGPVSTVVTESTTTTGTQDGKPTALTATKKQTTDAPAPAPSWTDRLLSPGTVQGSRLLVLVLVAFLVAAAVQRVVLGRYALKIGPLQIEDALPPAAAGAPAAVSAGLTRHLAGAGVELASFGSGTGFGTTSYLLMPEPGLAGARDASLPAGAPGLVALGAATERVLRSLAGPGAADTGMDDALQVLVARGMLDESTASEIGRLLDASGRAGRGAEVPARVANAVRNTGPVLLGQLEALRAAAGELFRKTVLEALSAQLPDGAVLVEPSAARSRADAVVQLGDGEIDVQVVLARPPDPRAFSRAHANARSGRRLSGLLVVAAGLGAAGWERLLSLADATALCAVVDWDSADERARLSRQVAELAASIRAA
jgi:hypothetical protein